MKRRGQRQDHRDDQQRKRGYQGSGTACTGQEDNAPDGARDDDERGDRATTLGHSYTKTAQRKDHYEEKGANDEGRRAPP